MDSNFCMKLNRADDSLNPCRQNVPNSFLKIKKNLNSLFKDNMPSCNSM